MSSKSVKHDESFDNENGAIHGMGDEKWRL